MRNIFKIGIFIFREGVREKVFVGLLFFLLFIMGVCAFLGKISAGEEVRILRNAGLAGIELCGLLVILFFVSQNFYQKKYSKTLDLFLVNFRKEEFLAGSLLGYSLILFSFLALAHAFFIPVCLLYDAHYPGLIVAFIFTVLKLSIILGACLVFSVFFESPLASFLSTLFFYFSAEASHSALRIVSARGSAFQRIFVKILYRILPNMDKVDIKSLASYGQYPRPEFVIHAFVYSVIYASFLFLLSLLIFKTKEYA